MKLLKKYFSIIFVLATLIGVLHHHNDLNIHNDCQICTIQSNIANADTPPNRVYVTELSNYSESIVSTLLTPHADVKQNPLNARAPPKIS